MIHELRVYTLGPGQVPAMLKLVEELAIPIRGDEYGKLEGYWLTEFGALNQVVHLWSHEDLNARQENRARLAQNADWTGKFLPQAVALIRHQEIRLMHPRMPLKAPTTEGNIYEYRYYRVETGTAPKWLEVYGEVMPAREKYSPNVCVWQTEAAEPNEVSHMWVYPNFDERMAVRGRLAGDPDWRAFLKKGGPLIKEMRNLALIPAPFSPMR